jgi:hypothetical protein
MVADFLATLSTLTRLRKSFGEQTELRDSVPGGGSEIAAPWLLTAHCAPVYSRSRRGIEALQSRMVLVVH